MNSTKTKAVSRRPARGGEEGGFTILETVIALFIAMMLGFGAISLFIFSVNFNAGATDRARAFALAQQRVEALRALPYTSLTATTATANTGAVQVGSTAASESDRRTFNVTTTIADHASVIDSRMKVITVTVTPATAGRWSAGAVTLRLYRASPEVE